MLDADDFSRALRAADQARAGGDLDTAVRRLREALALWCGPALTGVTGPGVDRHRPELDGRHLAALRARLEIDLALGHEQRILPELRSLADAHPLDEHLRLLLMRALYRCGRQADAIASNQECLRLLRDELGVDPDPRLQQLYGRILRADETLLSASVVPSVPAQLPAPSAAFVGRAKEPDRMAALSDGGVVVISGMAGVGKTTLALYGAHRIAERFGDGHLYADMNGFAPGRDPTPPGEILDRFLQALGVRRRARRSRGARRAVPQADHRAEAAEPAGQRRRGRQVRDLLPVRARVWSSSPAEGRSRRCSRASAPGCWCCNRRRTRRRWRCSRHGSVRTGHAPSPVAAREIVAFTGGLPLALAVVAARAVAQEHLPLSAIAAELREAHGTLDAFGGADDVRTVLLVVPRALTGACCRAARPWCAPRPGRERRRGGEHAGASRAAHQRASAAKAPANVPVPRLRLTAARPRSTSEARRTTPPRSPTVVKVSGRAGGDPARHRARRQRGCTSCSAFE
ncbi:BTAD domain-containing putative transcriptional regulator [Streptomyces fodineus]|uniref:BTAD domain-containing putative transcriptional regulator n=1 Tax=Streptomyces fodineus TaxID=1904616 RepID=UPI0009A0D553|nr:BTAD domain-containing putative transcriptional regulator [Streptomyces fodineus]